MHYMKIDIVIIKYIDMNWPQSEMKTEKKTVAPLSNMWLARTS